MADFVPPDAASARRARTAFESLDADDRALIGLAHFDHLTLRQIADYTGAPLDTVRRRTSEALHSFKDALADRSTGL